MTAIYAVAGRPVLHSLSPVMFNAAFGELSMDAVYTRLAAFDGRDIIDTARTMGIRGLNVTSPFKEEVIPFLDDLDHEARAVGSVNTVVREEGSFKGYNTDHHGVRDALSRHAVPCKGKRAVVLGASGAGRAAALALLVSGSTVTLVNRSGHKAEKWAHALGCESLPMEAIDEAVRGADILVSCITSPGRIVTPSSLKAGLTVFDAAYGQETALRKDARAAGCRLIDGREWLLFQALPAFRIMTGQVPPERVMREALFGDTPSKKDSIGLIGFMAAGKSTTGAGLAAALGVTALDTDAAIAAGAGLSIPEIFARSGLDGFRALEEEAIDRIRETIPGVVSFGGGSVMSGKNVDIMRNRCISVWLWANPETVRARTEGDTTRPLLGGNGGAADAEALLFSRLPFYARASDLIVDTDRATPEEIVERICREIDTAR